MLSDNIYREDHIPSNKERFLLHFRQNNFAVVAFWFLLLLILLTIFAPLIASTDANLTSNALLLPPSWNNRGTIEYFLGTDNLGRDILSRLIMGSRYTFAVAVYITIVATIIGGSLGVLAGMTKGLLSSALNHILDTVMSLPSILLVIIFIAFWGTSVDTIIYAICLSLIPRLLRNIYLAIQEEIGKEYIMAARLDGAKNFYLLWHSILPNILPVIATEITFALTIAILDISTFNFLGYGSDQNIPSWGTMIGESITLIYSAPWTIVLPGLAILFTLIMINLVGDGIRKALNTGSE